VAHTTVESLKIRRIKVQANLDKKRNPISKITRAKRAGDVAPGRVPA
jgi:hypothetical protein